MIVLLAILNDMPIMTITYDNVRYSAQPERWNMRTVLGIATTRSNKSRFYIYPSVYWKRYFSIKSIYATITHLSKALSCRAPISVCS